MRIRELEVGDANKYRELRLRALKEHATAFSSSYEQQRDRPVSTFAEQTGKQSIHIADWPSAAEFEGIPDPASTDSFAVACDAIAAVRKAKTDLGLGMGRPLASLVLEGSADSLKILTGVIADVGDGANASGVDVNEGNVDGERFAATIEPEEQEEK